MYSIGYLKLFQLRKMILTGYNCLLIDEAQDITPGREDNDMYTRKISYMYSYCVNSKVMELNHFCYDVQYVYIAKTTK